VRCAAAPGQRNRHPLCKFSKISDGSDDASTRAGPNPSPNPAKRWVVFTCCHRRQSPPAATGSSGRSAQTRGLWQGLRNKPRRPVSSEMHGSIPKAKGAGYGSKSRTGRAFNSGAPSTPIHSWTGKSALSWASRAGWPAIGAPIQPAVDRLGSIRRVLSWVHESPAFVAHDRLTRLPTCWCGPHTVQQPGKLALNAKRQGMDSCPQAP